MGMARQLFRAWGVRQGPTWARDCAHRAGPTDAPRPTAASHGGMNDGRRRAARIGFPASILARFHACVRRWGMCGGQPGPASRLEGEKLGDERQSPPPSRCMAGADAQSHGNPSFSLPADFNPFVAPRRLSAASVHSSDARTAHPSCLARCRPAYPAARTRRRALRLCACGLTVPTPPTLPGSLSPTQRLDASRCLHPGHPS